MKVLRYSSGLLCALLLALSTACSTLGLVQPESPAQRLAYVDTQIAVVVEELADARDAGLLTEEQISDVDTLVEVYSKARELAYAALNSDRPETALEYISLLESVLVKLQGVQHE